MDKATELFCLIDDFCQQFEPLLETRMLERFSVEDDSGKRRHTRPCLMSLSEMSTIVVLFHRMRARQFKAFYLGIVCRFMKAEFPRRLSYSRFVQLMPRCAAGLAALFQTLKGACTGICIADSTPLACWPFATTCVSSATEFSRILPSEANRPPGDSNASSCTL